MSAISGVSQAGTVIPQNTFKSNPKANLPKPDSIKEHPNYYELTYETEASSGKKWGVGIGSAFLPGLGQAINGQWGKGIGFFLGNILGAALAIPMIMLGDNSRTGAVVGLAGAALSLLLPRIWSITDAVKNAKGEVKQIVPKDDERLNITA